MSFPADALVIGPWGLKHPQHFEVASILPPVNDAAYVRDWAVPGTAARLKRLANEIAMFARNGKRKRSADMSSAVSDWESDLRYLHRTYYVVKFGFGWPHLGR